MQCRFVQFGGIALFVALGSPVVLAQPTPIVNASSTPAVRYDPAMPPVPVAELQSVLDRDLVSALKSGALAPGTHAGVAIGVVEHGKMLIFTYGTARPDSIFEIGSITKTFTGVALAQMIEQGKVTLHEPVRELLPAGTVAKPPGPEITLLNLVTHHSGLPFMPGNFHPADKNNPFADYAAADLYAYLRKHGVTKPANASYLYSNLGFGLLGQALANRAGTTYTHLVREEITGPLGMKDTVATLSPEQQRRFIQGYDAKHRPVHPWDDTGALAGAAALRSTAGDLLIYLQANLHPEKFSSQASASTAPAHTLSSAIRLSHKLRADATPGDRIAFAWRYTPATGSYWHKGSVSGYRSYAFFNSTHDDGAVALFNTKGQFANRLGEHIDERLNGRPAIALWN